MLILNLSSFWSLDERLFRLIHIDLHREFLDRIMLLITYTGDGHIQIPILLGLAINKRTRAIAYPLMAAYVLTGIIRLALKEVVGRPRPSNLDWANPISWPGGMPAWLSDTFDIIPYGNSSFPSGHSATSFAIAFMLAWVFYKSEHAWIAWAASLWATLVGLSRIYIGVHYPADVLAAAALAGICCTLIFLLWQSKNWLPYPINHHPRMDLNEPLESE